jgi:hypothetical protein
LEKSLTEVVRWTADYLLHHPADDEPTVLHALGDEGIDEMLAGELLAFVPLAFCRAILRDQQKLFEPHYDVHDPKTDRWQYGLPFNNQPIYQTAFDVAIQWQREGRSGNAILAVAGRSAEFRGINKLLHQGSKLENIRCTAPVVLGRIADPESARKKSSWRFWRSEG